MNSTILELKENIQLKPPDYNNGEFNVNLKTHLTLEDGDSVVMRNIFIDTVASSGGMIDIDEDTTLTMTFARGFNFSTQISDNDGTAADGLLLTPNALGYNIDENLAQADVKKTHLNRVANKGDSHIYYETKKTTVPAGHNKFRVATAMIFASDFQDHYRDHYGGFDVVFQYYDINGELQTYPTSLNNIKSPKEGGDDVDHTQSLGDNTFIFDGSKNFGNGGIALISPSASSMIKDHTTSPTIAFNSTEFASGDVYSMNTQSISVDIPAGAYDPNELARLITDGIVKVDQAEDKLFNGRSLPYTTKLLSEAASSTFENGEGLFISDDGEVALRIRSTDPNTSAAQNKPIVGASEFAFVFDGGSGASQTFKFTSLHSPYYVDTGGAGTALQIGNELTPVNTGTAQNPAYIYYNDKKKGDIIITGLEPFQSFWNEKLGISGNIIGQSQNKPFKIAVGGGQSADIHVPVLSIQAGVNMTEPFLGTDVLIPKNKFIPLASDYATVLKFPNLNTTSIYGEKTLNQITNINGYFLIEVRGYNNGTRIIGSNNIDDISAIVSRYYTSPSYTNGYSSDSIVYTHSGQSVELSNFTIRILDPDRTPAKGIGTNSCVYLMIEKPLKDEQEETNSE